MRYKNTEADEEPSGHAHTDEDRRETNAVSQDIVHNDVVILAHSKLVFASGSASLLDSGGAVLKHELRRHGFASVPGLKHDLARLRIHQNRSVAKDTNLFRR